MLVRINRPLFAALLLIGCLSSIMPVAAAIVPALGGYTTRESMIYEATESHQLWAMHNPSPWVVTPITMGRPFATILMRS